MKQPNYTIPILLIQLSILTPLITCTENNTNNNSSRRILHQPLFPATSSPPPPPPSTPDSLNPDQPFFHELPSPPPPPPSSTTTAAEIPATTRHPSHSTTKAAILISTGILTLVMLSVLAFYLLKHRGRRTLRDESEKPFSGENSRRRANDEESRMPPPSTFLYIGTVEPYRKLNSRYRPSPELQPLPPLKKPAPADSPPPMSSSDDDESNDTDFYTPQGSSVGNGSPSSNNPRRNSAKSKRTSPKSRVSETKPVVIIPSIVRQNVPPSPPPPLLPESSSLGPLQASDRALSSYAPPKRAKFPGPMPSLDIARLRSISNDDDRDKSKSATPTPPPPPPPPPQLRKFEGVEKKLPVSKEVIKTGSRSPSPKASNAGMKNIDEGDKSGTNSLEKCDGVDKDGSKPKLKPLHWDKVRATSERATVWDQLNSNSFQLNEGAMESLFGCSSVNSGSKEATKRSGLPAVEQENRVLDPKKSQNIAILLRALNVTREEVSEALLDGNPEGMGPELLETLVKMAPTKEEEIKLKDYNGDTSKLGSAERFLKAILDIPFAFKRVEAMLYRANFDTEVTYLRKSFQTLEEASEELKNSRLFLKLLEAVLRTGNRMNDGTNRGDARAFKLDTLLKLVDVKGTDGKTTLLHFVVQEIIRSEGADNPNPATGNQSNKTNLKFNESEFKKQELQVVSGLSKELASVKKAAGMDSDVLSSYVSKLEMGLEKVRLVTQYERQSVRGKFFDSMKGFLDEAVKEIARIKAEERKALSLVKEVTEYFHGDTAKEEAHPFRIFVIVRDFLSVLDNVCRDVGRMQDRATVGAGRSFRMPPSASLPVLNRYNMRHDRSSDDDSL